MPAHYTAYNAFYAEQTQKCNYSAADFRSGHAAKAIGKAWHEVLRDKPEELAYYEGQAMCELAKRTASENQAKQHGASFDKKIS